MSQVAQDFYNMKYETSIPSFVICSDKLVWHRPANKMLDYPALTEKMSEAGYTPLETEIGSADSWLLDNLGIGDTATPEPGVTATVAGTGTDSATITITGPANADGSIAITGIASGGVSVEDQNVPFSDGDSADDIALAVSLAMEGLMDAGMTIAIVTAISGSIVTVAENSGGIIDAGLTATVS